MVVDGRFIGCSLVCLLAFGLGLLASDPKCFEQSADKTDLKGNCMGSEVLVVKTQELKVTLKSTSLPKEVERFILTIGGCKIEGLYGPFGTHALIRREGHDYDLPLELTIMPGKFVAKNAKFKHEFDCSSTFEQNGNMYTIKVDYSADEAEKLDSLTATFDATVFVADEKSNTKEIITWIAIGLVVLIVIAAILIIIILCCFMKQKHDLVENDESYSQKSDRKKKPKKKTKKSKKLKGSQSAINTQHKNENTETKGNQPDGRPLSLLKPQNEPYVAQPIAHEPPVGSLAAPLAQEDERQAHAQASRSNPSIQLAAAQPSASTDSRPKPPEGRLLRAGRTPASLPTSEYDAVVHTPKPKKRSIENSLKQYH